MALDHATETMLLQSIAADRLIVVCGAGLSMAPPSQIPSAQDISRVCYDAYANMGIETIAASLRDDLEGLSEHFASQNRLETFFLRRLMPWDVFVRAPNAGHAAIADLLYCRALEATVTTNYDFLVEESARIFGSAFSSALDGDQARKTLVHAPYLKIHGCSVKDPDRTVWASSQLKNDAIIAGRIANSGVWLTSELRDKDLVFIGFWSDWKYLNAIIESALSNVSPSSVLLVDPDTSARLQAKAPALWTFVNSGAAFNHIRMSGADFLNDLRAAFSRSYIVQAITAGRTEFEHIVGPVGPLPLITTIDDNGILHEARCDAEGIPRSRAPRHKCPQATKHFAFSHLLMSHAGARPVGAEYEHAGKRVRIVNGADQFVNQMKSKYGVEPASVRGADIVICAGATDLGVPSSIVRSGVVHSIVRPMPGGEWLDLAAARVKLGI